MTSPKRSVLHKRVNGHLTGDTISFPTVLCPRHEQWVNMKLKGKKRRRASRWCKSGRCDGWQELFVLGAYVLVHIHVLPLERCVVMDERHPLPVQQWKCLKHLGPRDGPCHSPPILVTYGPAMLNTPGLLLWVWRWRGCNIIVHVMTETRPPGRSVPLCCQPENIKCFSSFLQKRGKK